jgi:hypothetical protein
MSDDRPDGLTMIGLHKLASVNGEGLVPELYALMSQRDTVPYSLNVIAFPRQAARPPGDVPAVAFGRDAATGRNVVAFAALPGKTSGRSRKA